MTLEKQYIKLGNEIKEFNRQKHIIEQKLNQIHKEREKIKELLNGQIPLDI